MTIREKVKEEIRRVAELTPGQDITTSSSQTSEEEDPETRETNSRDQ